MSNERLVWTVMLIIMATFSAWSYNRGKLEGECKIIHSYDLNIPACVGVNN